MMPSTMRTVATNAYRNRLRDAHTGESLIPSYFRIGEGGWERELGTVLPIPPSVDQENLDCIENSSDYDEDSRYYFQKTLTSSRISTAEEMEVTIICELLPGDANDDGLGNAPEFYELGVFLNDDTMMAYATFPMVQKFDSTGVTIRLTIQFPAAA